MSRHSRRKPSFVQKTRPVHTHPLRDGGRRQDRRLDQSKDQAACHHAAHQMPETKMGLVQHSPSGRLLVACLARTRRSPGPGPSWWSVPLPPSLQALLNRPLKRPPHTVNTMECEPPPTTAWHDAIASAPCVLCSLLPLRFGAFAHDIFMTQSSTPTPKHPPPNSHASIPLEHPKHQVAKLTASSM